MKNARITGTIPTKNNTCQPQRGKMIAERMAAIMPPSCPPIAASDEMRP